MDKPRPNRQVTQEELKAILGGKSPSKIGPKCKASPDRSRYGKRHRTGEMNKTETAFAEYLQAELISGKILKWRFESQVFRLAKALHYRPDFQIIHLDGTIEFVDCKVDVKAAIDPKSIAKIKLAAEEFWEYIWTVRKRRKNGTWSVAEY